MDSQAKDRKKLSGDLGRMGAVLLFFAALGYVLSLPSVREQVFDIGTHRDRIDESGAAGALFFFVVAGLLTGFGIPRLWISVAAGALFGAAGGTVMGHFASLLGATINFCIARWFLRGPVKRRMPRRMRVWYELFNRNGFRYLLYLRFFPLSNATVTNVIGGVSRMRYRDFFAASFIGYLPLTIVFAIFGSSAAKQQWWQLAIGAVLLVSVWLVERAWRARMAGASRLDDDTESADQP